MTAQPALQHGYARVNGIRIHYVEAGSGPLMLFLHGFPEFWYAWDRQLRDFGRDHQAVAPDMRGYNETEKPEALDAYRVSTLVEDIRALADHLGAQRFVLVGHDWGGVVAWAFAAAHPDRLEQLVIINAPHPAIFGRELQQNPAQQRASAYMLLFRSPAAETALSANKYERLTGTLLDPLQRDGHFTAEDRAAYLRAWAQPGALTGGLNYYRAAQLGPDLTSETDTGMQAIAQPSPINVPTRVIWGERDTALLTGNLDGLDAYVADLTIRRVPEGTHWLIHEQPDLINRTIREFLSRLG
ncbi:MAG: alpha/beta fold hydrolase [Chloroflexota bacterium]